MNLPFPEITTAGDKTLGHSVSHSVAFDLTDHGRGPRGLDRELR